ncbi:MAG: MoxR family ATPase [Planctomycetaceae bacterium]|nr:MoxR family ATPase [Planctomycetaceae bacterium]
MTDTPPPSDDLAAVQQLRDAYKALTDQLAKRIVGQRQVIEEMLIAILAGGHCLLVGVPGLAKTLMVHTLADALELSFNRIQFTPDLMPADITGTELLQEDRSTGAREFRFVQGPVFANVVLADEINRTPPKTQAALLEAMQEHQVTVGGHRHRLPEPFFVLATQNPIEQEGTYPLPEAQQDRFMLQVRVDYPTEDEEFQIVRQMTTPSPEPVEQVLKQAELMRLQDVVRRMPVADHVLRYAMSLTRWTRQETESAPDFVREYVTWGAGPRASQHLVMAAKAHAMLHGREHVSIQDVQSVAAPVIRHRIVTNFNAEADGITANEIIRRLIEVIPTDPRETADLRKLPNVFAAASTADGNS